MSGDGVSISGFVAIGVFYLLILGVGLWAGNRNCCKRKKQKSGNAVEGVAAESAMSKTDDLMLAGRNIGLFIGCFTMTG